MENVSKKDKSLSEVFSSEIVSNAVENTNLIKYKMDEKGIKPDICLYRAKDNFKLDDVQGFRFDVCPAEDRYGRRIDIDLAKEFLNQRLRLN